jgi:hypothetical protein
VRCASPVKPAAAASFGIHDRFHFSPIPVKHFPMTFFAFQPVCFLPLFSPQKEQHVAISFSQTK